MQPLMALNCNSMFFLIDKTASVSYNIDKRISVMYEIL